MLEKIEKKLLRLYPSSRSARAAMVVRETAFIRRNVLFRSGVGPVVRTWRGEVLQFFSAVGIQVGEKSYEGR
jgi:hypothetical protein